MPRTVTAHRRLPELDRSYGCVVANSEVILGPDHCSAGWPSPEKAASRNVALGRLGQFPTFR